MKVAVIGATGRIGSKITAELLQRGHAVTAIARNPEKAPSHPNLKAVKGDVTDPQSTAPSVSGHDAVISSAPFIPGISIQVLETVRRSGVKRYIAVGGAGSLKATDGKLVMDNPQIPAEWLPSIKEGAALLKLLRADHDLEWTFFSPAVFIGPGERTGKFRLGGDEVVAAADGKSSISYDDYAIALVDELERPKHVRARFTIGY
jgi:putative NADH-flavin reductase